MRHEYDSYQCVAYQFFAHRFCPNPSPTASVDEWDHIFAINTRGTFLCYKAAAKAMIELNTKNGTTGGKIIGMIYIYNVLQGQMVTLTIAGACSISSKRSKLSSNIS
jgi:NAD(P)-dependent dehydrogenase (short-subunit alcohol dehydrogenase family)